MLAGSNFCFLPLHVGVSRSHVAFARHVRFSENTPGLTQKPGLQRYWTCERYVLSSLSLMEFSVGGSKGHVITECKKGEKIRCDLTPAVNTLPPLAVCIFKNRLKK